mmetsp:Transcript_117524/g.226728  ORF Transcript_117524/g.226728 Transcript_117524/m.226728 type:complete len:433 (+) Transcript_117524:71-1369(+)
MAPKRPAESAAGPAAKRSRGGGRSVDSKVPNAGSMKVVDDYAITLNQTHIDTNNNKFYVIQVLEGGGKFYSWNRWGRVGEDGQNKLLACPSKDKAVSEFEKKFREKTKNQWANRGSFKPAAGKYTIVETEDSGKGGGSDAPMGKLTEAQIGKGQKVLDKLKKALKSPKQVEELSSEFYTLIPHDFGRKRPPLIDSMEKLTAQEDLLKFFLRMGFDSVETKSTVSPISGVMELPVPRSLDEACKGICDKSSVKTCESNGSDLAKKQAGKPKKKMEPSFYGAIMLYTSNAIYSQINKALRDEDRGKVKKYFKYLRLFFEAALCLPQQKKTLWRGISVDLFKNAQYEVGKTVTWWSISSCTSDKKVADGFAGGCGGGCTVFTVNAKTAFDAAALSMYQSEKESILCPGTKLKVKSKTQSKGITQITLEEVGRAIE